MCVAFTSLSLSLLSVSVGGHVLVEIIFAHEFFATVVALKLSHSGVDE